MGNTKASIPSNRARNYIREREGVVSIRWTWVCMG
jgi:hypothetical protein